jgi:hypothetical protein
MAIIKEKSIFKQLFPSATGFSEAHLRQRGSYKPRISFVLKFPSVLGLENSAKDTPLSVGVTCSISLSLPFNVKPHVTMPLYF